MDRFKKTILNFNTQLSPTAISSFHLNKLSNIDPDIIIFCGMGGSGQAGDLIAGLKTELKIPVPIIIWKNYGLPILDPIFKNPLYIFVSFSGNTKETISGFEKTDAQKAVVCAGGKLKSLADKNNSPLAFINLKEKIVSRQAIGYLFYGIIKIIKNVFPDIKISLVTEIKPLLLEKEGQKTASQLKGRIILIYSSLENSFLAYFWKTALNETSKNLAFSNFLPEMAHNEITTLEKNKNIAAIFLNDDKKNNIDKKTKTVIKLLKTNKIPVIEINLEGKNRLEKIWKNTVLALWTSYYLARSKKIDPEKTKFIDKIKNLTK